MKFKNLIFISAIILGTVSKNYSQTTQVQLQKIDSVFNSWNQPNYPGGTVVISSKGKTIFSKSYGLANLEYNIPNTTNTHFNIGSIAKQFTAMGIVLLEAQQQLSFDDDVRKHLPSFPNFGTTITIRHLLLHTSGLRDIHGLLGLAGWRSNDVETNEDLYRIIKNQKDLNFTPGEEFLYCNTGYILLAKIIENTSDVPFDQWMKKNIFLPLGMKNTYVETGLDHISSNNASSYYTRKRIKKALPYWGYFGSGNIQATAKDMNIWLQNFSNPPQEWSRAFSKLLQTTPLLNGFTTNYGFGVRIHQYKGKKLLQHGGSIGGFRAVARTFPQEQLAITILSNFSGSNIGSKVNKISNILLKTTKKTPTINRTKTVEQAINFIKLSPKKLARFEGVYWSDEEKIGRRIYIKKDTLRYASSATNYQSLLPLSAHTFKMINTGQNTTVTFNSTTQQMTITSKNNIPGVFRYLQNHTDKNTKNHQSFEGNYYSPELKTVYSIATNQNGNLYLEHARHGIIKLTQAYNTIFYGHWPIGVVEFKTTTKGKVVGLKISNGRVRNVYFQKSIPHTAHEK